MACSTCYYANDEDDENKRDEREYNYVSYHTCNLSKFKKSFRILVLSAVGAPIKTQPNNTKFNIQIYYGTGSNSEILEIIGNNSDIPKLKLEYQGIIDKNMDASTFPTIIIRSVLLIVYYRRLISMVSLILVIISENMVLL